METIGKRLKDLRSRKGLKVQDVASALKIAPSTYRDWEQGRAIKGEPYEKLVTLFDTTFIYLLTGRHPVKSELRQAVHLLSEAVEIIKKYDRSL